jgi:hypothetical protein
MAVMPELITKESIIGKSPSGAAVLAFDTEAAAKRWIALGKPHRIKFFKQTITEEEVEITLD